FARRGAPAPRSAHGPRRHEAARERARASGAVRYERRARASRARRSRAHEAPAEGRRESGADLAEAHGRHDPLHHAVAVRDLAGARNGAGVPTVRAATEVGAMLLLLSFLATADAKRNSLTTKDASAEVTEDGTAPWETK